MSQIANYKGLSRWEFGGVLVIMVTLFAFVLPALQKAREVARKNKCASNIGNIALAQQNFHLAHGAFAPSSHSPKWREVLQGQHFWDRISWIASTLPYLEKTELYEQIEPFHKTEGAPWIPGDLAGRSSPYTTNIPALRCPADNLQISSTDCKPTNYVGNRGDIYLSSFDWEWRGVFANGGTGHASHETIKDGLSNTLLLAELAVGRTTAVSGKYSVIEGTALYSMAAPGTHWTPSACEAARGPNNLLVTKYVSGSWGDAGWGKGRRWGDAFQNYTGFFAILPPNSPTCSSKTGEEDVMTSSSSWHQGGVYVAMCDASVRFVSEKIDSGDVNAKLTTPPENTRTYSGPSLWGIWGAMGSANGGENIVIPE